MPFGYAPDRKRRKDLLLRIVGFPNMIRRIQAPVIMRMMGLEKDEAVLDAGCGQGSFTYEIAKKCGISVGVDLSLTKGSSLITGNQHRLAYLRGDIQRIPLASEKFDKILLSSVLQMVKDDRALLSECRRLLKKKGRIILSVPLEYVCLKRLNQLKPQLFKRWEVLGKGSYKLDEVVMLLRKEGFRILKAEYSPKKWGSLVFEIALFLSQRFHFPSFKPFLFPVLYFIAYSDRFASRWQIGDEVIVSACKI